MALLPLVVFLPSPLQAQDAPATQKAVPAEARRVTLEEIPEAVARNEQELPKKMEALLALVGKEAAAKRITEAAAQSLRFSLRSSRASLSGDLRGLLTTSRVPEDNRALLDAFAELEALTTTVQSRRAELGVSALEDFRSRIVELFRSARKPEEVDSLIALIGPARDALTNRSSYSVGRVDLASVFSSGRNLLDGLKAVLVAQGTGDAEALRGPLEALIQSNRATYDQLNVQGAVQTRVSELVKPLLAESEARRKALDAAITERKPIAEVSAAMQQFERSSEAATALRNALTPNSRTDSRYSLDVYRRIISLAESLEQGDPSVTQSFRDVRQALRQLPAEVAPALDRALAGWERETKESAAKKSAERASALRQRLADVREPVGLDDLAATVAGWGREATEGRGGERENYAQLAQTLSFLAAAWSAGDPQILQQHSGMADELRNAYGAELRALRTRVDRHIMSRVLAAPELNQPPLADQAPDAAVSQLAAQLSEKGEWRRLLRLVELRSGLRAGREFQRPEDLPAAIRAFLAGQNFESAELWGDAVRSYKSVLNSSSELAPIKAAAERLKSLAAEHPEAVALPSP
ncbi:MAG TPA: hypothetical protein VF614_13320 [Chthoniobacteraceae bacterium]